MTYKFDFSSVLAQWPLFVHGAWLTIKLSLAATLLGLVIGTLCAIGRGRPQPLRGALLRDLCRGHPQHALAGADLPGVFRAAQHRA
jgi:ABC-type amino acid transport system permease subunit